MPKKCGATISHLLFTAPSSPLEGLLYVVLCCPSTTALNQAVTDVLKASIKDANNLPIILRRHGWKGDGFVRLPDCEAFLSDLQAYKRFAAVRFLSGRTNTLRGRIKAFSQSRKKIPHRRGE